MKYREFNTENCLNSPPSIKALLIADSKVRPYKEQFSDDSVPTRVHHLIQTRSRKELLAMQDRIRIFLMQSEVKVIFVYHPGHRLIGQKIFHKDSSLYIYLRRARFYLKNYECRLYSSRQLALADYVKICLDIPRATLGNVRKLIHNIFCQLKTYREKFRFIKT